MLLSLLFALVDLGKCLARFGGLLVRGAFVLISAGVFAGAT